MSNKLETILSKAASLREELAQLKPSDSLDNTGEIARQRAELNAHLEVLAEAENQEREKIEAEVTAEREQRRKAYLAKVVQAAREAQSSQKRLTDEVHKAMSSLVKSLVSWSEAYELDTFDFSSQEAKTLLSDDEAKYLRDATGSLLGIKPSPAHFSVSWGLEVDKAKGKADLKALVYRQAPDSITHTSEPLTANNAVALINRALELSEKKLSRAKLLGLPTFPQREPEPAPHMQVVDLRS